MEKEFGEIINEVEKIGVSEKDEDIALENPTVTISQQLKKSRKASGFKSGQNQTPVYQKPTGIVYNAATQKTKKKKDIFVS